MTDETMSELLAECNLAIGLVELTPNERVRLMLSLREAGAFIAAAESFLANELDALSIKALAGGFQALGFEGHRQVALNEAVINMLMKHREWTP